MRSYRQALGLAAPHLEDGRTNLWLEYVAALALAGDMDRARMEIAGPPPRADRIEALPAWAREALRSNGLVE